MSKANQSIIWNPDVAGVLSLFIPGAGQMYKGQIAKGIIWLIASVIGYALFVVPGIIICIFCVYNAVQEGNPNKTIPFGQLLSESWSFCTTYWKTILIGAAIFGTLAALLWGGVANRTEYGVNVMMNQMGIDQNKMQELSVRIQNGDESAMAEMEVILNQKVVSMDDDTKAMMVGRVLTRFAPLIGIAALIGIIIAVFGQAYFLLLALSPTQDAMAVLRKTPALFFPLLGVWIWMALRSFVWIPILGLIPAIILGPRFVLAPVIMVKEKKGIMESVRLSYARTAGYWGKIAGNVIVAALCIMLAAIVVAIVAGIIGFIIPLAGLWLQSIARFVFSAFMVAFIVQLAFTIMANPVGGAKKAKK